MAIEEPIRVGVLADPGLATRLVQSAEEELPDLLKEQTEGGPSYEVEVIEQAIPLNPEGAIDLKDAVVAISRDNSWDYTIVVTELPRRDGTRPLLVDAEPALAAAIISLPALGFLGLRQRMTRAVVRAVTVLRSRGFAEDEPAVFRTSSAMLGRTRLLMGMIRINRPWRLVPSLSTAMAAAAAASAFGIFYSSIWQMAVSLSPLRLALISILAITAMVTWLIGYNRLWERRGGSRTRDQAVLYNVATVLTIGAGVTLMYIGLYIAILIAAFTVVSEDYLSSVLERETRLADYLMLSWLAASMGTVAGALGSSAEDDDDIKRATFGHREWERRKVRSDSD